jgi:membrane protease YdiL (CAAX protease family)
MAPSEPASVLLIRTWPQAAGPRPASPGEVSSVDPLPLCWSVLGSSPAVRAFEIWAAVALLALLPVTLALDASFPIFTVVWIVVPLIVVLRARDATRVGFRSVPTSLLLQTTAINLGLFFALMLAVEPWSHTYERLLEFVVSARPLDTTFGWLVRLPRPPALAAMALYSGLVTLFGEELFFRGWLLQAFRSRSGTASAIVLQAILFAVPNTLVAFALPLPEGILYVIVYAWLTIGIVGGWAAARTGSIWPSLVTATVGNLVMVGLLQ